MCVCACVWCVCVRGAVWCVVLCVVEAVVVVLAVAIFGVVVILFLLFVIFCPKLYTLNIILTCLLLFLSIKMRFAVEVVVAR